MKLFFTLFLLILFSWSFAADEKVADGGQTKEDLFNAFLDHPKVKPTYEACLKKQEKGTLKTTIAECVWDDVDDSMKKQFNQAVGILEKQANTRTPASADKQDQGSDSSASDNNTSTAQDGSAKENQNKKTYEGVYLGTVKTHKDDEALKAVRDYLTKRLEKSIYGDDPNQKKVFAHNEFYSLYKSQIGKNIIAATTNYCLEAKLFDKQKGADLYLIPDDEADRKANREDNISRLKNFKGEKNEIHEEWATCAKAIQSVCYKNVTKIKREQNTTRKIDYTDIKDDSYAKKMACQVTNYIREHRQNLLITDAIKNKLQEETGKNGASSTFQSNIKNYEYGKGKDEENMNEMTTVSSGEFFDAYKEKANEVAEDFETKCLENQNSEECKKYLFSGDDKKELQKKLHQYELRVQAMYDKIDDMESTDEIKKYLAEEGYTQENIDSMLAGGNNKVALKDAISKHFKSEKESLDKVLKEDIDKYSSVGESFDMEADQAKLVGIAEELKTRGKKYQEMLHFSNVVSSFLAINITDAEGNQSVGRNTASLFREINYEEENSGARTPAEDSLIQAGSITDIEKLKQNAGKAGIEDTTDEDDKTEGSRDLDIETVNTHFLNYNEVTNPGGQSATPSTPNNP